MTISYEEVREMPLEELLMYHQALKEICERYEFERRPLYNSTNPKDQARWVEINNELQFSKKYYDVVMNAMKYKCYNDLDNYTRPKKTAIKAPVAKKKIEPVRRARKEKK